MVAKFGRLYGTKIRMFSSHQLVKLLSVHFQWADVCYHVNYTLSDNYDLVTADIDDGCDGSDVYIATISASTSAELATKVNDTYAVNTNVCLFHLYNHSLIFDFCNFQLIHVRCYSEGEYYCRMFLAMNHLCS